MFIHPTHIKAIRTPAVFSPAGPPSSPPRENRFGPPSARAWRKYYADARGLYRIYNAAEYRFYRSNSLPLVTGSPFATNGTLPHTPATTFANGTWYVGVTYFNGVIESGFFPIGANGEPYVRIDVAGGVGIGSPPAGPLFWFLRAAPAGAARIIGAYFETGALRADQWAINYEIDPASPAAGAPIQTVAMPPTGMAVLDTLLSYAHTPGAPVTLNVRLQTRRDDGGTWRYSENSTVQSIECDETGPTQSLTLESWPGTLPVEE